MPFFNVMVHDCASYRAIKAETKEEAIEIAEGLFYERIPDVLVSCPFENEEEAKNAF